MLLGNREWLPAKAFIRGLTKLPPNFTGTTEYSPGCSIAEVIFSCFVCFTKLWRCCLSCGVTRGMPQLWWWHYAGDRLRIPGLGLLFPCLAELPCLLHWQSNTDQPGSAARLRLTFHWDMQLPRMSLENMKLRLNQE